MISICKVDETEEWNRIVKSFNDFDLYYLAEYTKAFEIHGDGEPILIYFQNDTIKGMNVVMKRDISVDEIFQEKIPTNTYFDITTPYGYGGFILEGEVTDENIQLLNTEYISFCKKNGIVSEFVRFHPVLNNSDILSSVYDISKLGKTITIDLESREQIWNNLIGKNRNVIRKAKKAGVNVYWGRNPELISKFIKIYNATMDRDDAKDYYYFKKDFYQSVLEDLKYNSMIFYAVYEKEIISMSMVLFANNQMHYHLSASNREYQHLSSTNLLLFEVACWGAENGFKNFHLGGGLGSQEDNLFKFKKAFNKNSETRFSIGKKIFSKEIYKDLLLINKRNDSEKNNSSYFPEYRG